MNIEEISNQIIFQEKEHRYFWNNQELTSVSLLISNYKPIFDPQGHIVRAVAKRDGISESQVKINWEKIKVDACSKGHDFHSQAEHFIKTGEILDGTYKDVVETFSKIKFPGPLKSEIMLFSEVYKIAGTADLVCLINDKDIELGDFKTNKKINLKSKYGNKLLYPLEHLDASEINIYSIQLGLYKYMLEEFGYNVKKITLHHINPETRNIDSYDIKYLKKEIKDVLEHFQSINEF
ncbi:MAG: hypothetical protein Q7R95_05990 [bacterium]|nr:hypothetical protein [bacterium]